MLSQWHCGALLCALVAALAVLTPDPVYIQPVTLLAPSWLPLVLPAVRPFLPSLVAFVVVKGCGVSSGGKLVVGGGRPCRPSELPICPLRAAHVV